MVRVMEMMLSQPPELATVSIYFPDEAHVYIPLGEVMLSQADRLAELMFNPFSYQATLLSIADADKTSISPSASKSQA